MKLNKINLSGVSYDLEDLNAAKTVELTQAEYDALTVKDPNTFYVITDAQAADLSSYYTKTETDGLLDTKLDVSAYTPTDLSNYYTKSETSGATEISTALAGKADTATTYTKTEVDNAITAATSAKQDTLVSGTNIKTVNNESLLGSGNIEIQGGGATYSAGTNISIDTANTISCTLPIESRNYNILSTNKSLYISNQYSDFNPIRNSNYFHSNIIVGYNPSGQYKNYLTNSIIVGNNNYSGITDSYQSGVGGGIMCGVGNNIKKSRLFSAFGLSNTGQTESYYDPLFVFGTGNETKNPNEAGLCKFNISLSGSTTFGDSGNTLFSIGNGYGQYYSPSMAVRHNALEIRQNGDLYFADTDNTTSQNYYEKPMVRLQDMYGELGNKLETSAITSAITSASTDSQVPSAKAVYDALQESGGGTVDTELDSTSENPVQNKVIYQKFDEVEDEITAATSGKQDTLVSGTNIKTINNESLLGSGNIEIQGGGATYSAGTNISIDTANTISCTLPFRVDDSSKRAISLGSSSVASGYNSLAFGGTCRVSGANSFSVGSQTNASGFSSVAFGIKTTTNNIAQASFGNNNITNGNSDYFAGNSGNTLFSVGNGNTDSARHNAFEIRQNGDLYFADTDNTTYQNYYQKPMVRLQDMYGALGGLKLVKLTQTEYDALATKDSNTLYVIVN